MLSSPHPSTLVTHVEKLPPRSRQYSLGNTDHVIVVSGRRDVSSAVRDGEHHATAT